MVRRNWRLARRCRRPDPLGGRNVSSLVFRTGRSARIDGYAVPRCTFSIYAYPDPGDPAVVAVDTVTSDLVITDPAQVEPYHQLYARLAAAALPPAGSLDLLTTAASQLPDH